MGWSLAGAVLSIVAFVSSLRVMRMGLEGLAKGRLPALLRQCAGTTTRGLLTGTLVSALLQSSAAVTAITVGLVAGGNLAFRDTIGIILGANVGTTLTSQLLTFNLWQFAVPALVLGLAALLTGWLRRSAKLHCAGLAIVGFAGIMIALEVLVAALHPLALTAWFSKWLATAGSDPLLALLTGCLASAMLQSSTATTVITMALAMDRLIPLEGAVCIILGANVGTCATSVIAAIGQSRAAMQVAVAHVLLNVAGAVLAFPFVDAFANLVTWIGGPANRQVANVHTIFNVVCTLLAWPIAAQFARLVERLLPDQRRAG
ncbi:Na/Pi cotransporter family protein [Alicyclobacillus cycloheptanicus]|uniref:Phosphate:Na+ symporter n=1 Tax=Alicyclobacillus cycloheptanicus TaxID=1457 RepID=A0ABT9XJJ3_9BACL|nr:Na/Pi symporter [Alicyclobacillus cycloheptanicus]MDQ0190480.1 phosphate:Na+ symporter [Alicyclobacillus cycloheptanicus]WDM00757.1 Na/Pi cotransporter family protein [Alicyclobacillus cycloheptanicus]